MVDASQVRARGRSTENPAKKTRRSGTRWKERAFFARASGPTTLRAFRGARFFALLLGVESTKAPPRRSPKGRDFFQSKARLRPNKQHLSLRALENPTLTLTECALSLLHRRTKHSLLNHSRHVWRRRLR